MGIYTYVPAWISEESFCGSNTLKGVVTHCKLEEKQNGKIELVIWIDTQHGEKCRMSIWGKNNSYFATKLGDGTSWDTDKLIGRVIKITAEKKSDKVLKHVVLE